MQKSFQKLDYLKRCVLSFGQAKVCPFCGHTSFEVLDKKYLVTSLLKCRTCGLAHRHPKDKESFLKKFYQVDYQVDVEWMTDLPSDAELAELKRNNFKELRDHLPFVHALFGRQDIKIVDYGCSWGYNVYKLLRCGVDAVGYELSMPKARFGEEKLGVSIATEDADIRDKNDLVFSSHVIEHLHSIQDFIALSKRKLKKDGIFISFCPNGSREYQRRQPDLFHVTWGSLHPNYLNIDFARYAFRNNPYMILTSDWPYDLEKIQSWDGVLQYVDDYKKGYELLIIAKPNIEI